MAWDPTPLYHDDETMQKVFVAMRNAGIEEGPGISSIMEMQEQGILFREIGTEENSEVPCNAEDCTVHTSCISYRAAKRIASDNPGISSTMTTNLRGEWVPSIPEPYYGFWKHCVFNRCEEVFWTKRGYQGHYALCHILFVRRASQVNTWINAAICVFTIFICLLIAGWIEFL